MHKVLGVISKRTDIFELLRNTDCDIYCLQETHFTDTEERSILNLWKGEYLFNNYRLNARGVVILFIKCKRSCNIIWKKIRI